MRWLGRVLCAWGFHKRPAHATPTWRFLWLCARCTEVCAVPPPKKRLR